MILRFDHEHRNVQVSLRAEEIIRILDDTQADEKW